MAQLLKIRNVLLLMGSLFGLVASVTFGLYHPPTVLADTVGCTASGGATCKEVFADGLKSPMDNVYPGQGAAFMEDRLRAFLYSGTGDNEKYMVYVISVTLNPDLNARSINLVTSGPDSSPTGDNSTIHVRLWSTNDRSACNGTPCNQRNYSDLEQANYCQSNGGSQTLSVGKDVGQGFNIGWSVSIPSYNWCTFTPSTDIWSQYNNYTLQDANQSMVRITQQFVFAQWESENCCGNAFDIGYSVDTHMFDPASKTSKPGPASGDTAATFSY